MFNDLLMAAAGLVMLYAGGESLVRGAAALASRAGIPPLAIGLTVVAFGTSTPELVVSVEAVVAGSSDIAIGNVLGSNIANIALVLGVSALIRPMRVLAKIIRIDAPLMVAASVLLAALLFDGRISRIEGALLLVGLVAFIVFTLREGRQESDVVQQEFALALPRKAIAGVPLSMGLVVAGLALLVGGGRFLIDSAVSVASSVGMSEAAIGLSIVAVGTSLPELTTSIVASVRGQGDIAIGNVLGSNIFNILGILGITAVVHPVAPVGITGLDIGVMVGLAVIATVLLSTRRRLDRIEGFVLFASFAAYMGYVIAF